MKKSKCFIFIILIFVFLTTACGNKEDMSSNNIIYEGNVSGTKPSVNIAALKGPSSLGMLKLIDKSSNDNALLDYNISIMENPSEIAAKLSNGEFDIITVPTNLAATLYNKMNSNVQILAVNTLGVLYVVSNDKNINEVSNIKGKTIYVSGQGATPEYALKYMLKQSGIDPEQDVNIEYKAEHSQLAQLLVSSEADLALLPEPFVTQVIEKNSNINRVLDINEEWDKTTIDRDVLAMGCIVAKKDYIEKNKSLIDLFLNEYKSSIDYTNNNLESVAKLSEKYDIMPYDIALKAIPKCNIVYMDSDLMKNKVSQFLQILFDFDNNSVGGSLPGEDFYYKK